MAPFGGGLNPIKKAAYLFESLVSILIGIGQNSFTSRQERDFQTHPERSSVASGFRFAPVDLVNKQ